MGQFSFWEKLKLERHWKGNRVLAENMNMKYALFSRPRVAKAALQTVLLINKLHRVALLIGRKLVNNGLLVELVWGEFATDKATLSSF